MRILPSTPTFTETKSTLQFLLDHPRRCYTTLFPSAHTWWLLGTLVLLNGIDWAAFEVLNVSNPFPLRHPSTSPDSPPKLPDRQRRPQHHPLQLPRPRRPLPGLRRPLRRLLRRQHLPAPHRPPRPLRHHDVHLRIPRRHHHAQLERLRRTLPRHLRRRPHRRDP